MSPAPSSTCAWRRTGDIVCREYLSRLVLSAGVAAVLFLHGERLGALLWWCALGASLGLEALLYRRFLKKDRTPTGKERAAFAATSLLCSTVNIYPAAALLTRNEPHSAFAAALFLAGTLIHLLVHNSANRMIFLSAAAPMAAAFAAVAADAAFRSGAILPALTTIVFLYAMGLAFLAKEAGERRLREALLDAERERAAALKASAAKTAFLAKMSHELRTPLNGVLGMAAALKESAGPDERARLDAIEASGEALLSLLTDALDVTRIETGGLSLSEAPADLRGIVAGALSRARPHAAAKGLALSVDLDGVRDAFLAIDAVRLSQALGHLLSNAVKFTASSGAVLVRVRTANGEGLIEVSDTGCGVSAEEAARIFRPFEQADNSIIRRHGGAGLGLALVAEIARAMGGGVSVRSEKGKGALFSFAFRYRPAPRAEDPAPSAAPAAPTLRGPEILLVEDNEINRKVVRALLRPLNASVTEAENGAIALERLTERRFDLVLMDLHMPVMDGLSATRAIRRAKAQFARTPIVALTAAVSEEDRAASFSAGVDDFLGKPVKGEMLIAAVRRLTEPRLQAAVS
jgi:signal transduction histidine kinase/ActR/RegA family two-component response regulator